jgi:hypothetical protein
MPADTADVKVHVRPSEAGDAHALPELKDVLTDPVPWAELNRLARQARKAWADARLADLRDSAERAAGEQMPAPVVRDLADRVKRAERDAEAAGRCLKVFQQRVVPGP